MGDDATEYMIDQLYQSMAVQDAEIERLRAENQRLRDEIAEHKEAVQRDGWPSAHYANHNLWVLIEGADDE